MANKSLVTFKSFVALPLCLMGLAVCASLALAEPGTSTSNSRTDVVFWVYGVTDIRIRHEHAVLKAALERTREEYGDYAITFSEIQLSTERFLRSLARGADINLVTTPAWALVDREESQSHIVPIPLARGLLGFRRCLIRRADRSRFNKIETLAQLRRVRIGMGQGWPDTLILNHNDLTVVEGKDLNQLYTMLKRKRLDCLPVGVGEAESFLATHEDASVVVAPQPLLFYSLPIFLQVNASSPLLAQRMEEGLEALRDDGTLERLFYQYYGDVASELAQADHALIRLTNPLVPPELQDLGLGLLDNSH